MLIVDLWRRMEGAYFCISTKSSSGQWKDHYFARDELHLVKQFLKDNADKDLYWCPHGLKKKSRKEDSAVPPKLLWADLDEADPRHMRPKPTIAIESSPGRYVGIWLIDKPMTKELNRALTYHVGADKSGWDFGQVLRIPGTINYKYPSHPKTKTMWDDLPAFTSARISETIRASMKSTAKNDPSTINASEVFQQYSNKFPVWLRRELVSKEAPKSGKRSEMIWKMEHALLEAGCNEDECFVLIKASRWNKFRGRHNEDEQLRRELDKIIEQRFDTSVESSIESPAKSYKFLAHSIDEAEEKNIDWIWHGRLARGELTIVEGDPGLGKSYFVQMVCKHLCDGEALPDMRPDERVDPCKVAYFDIENDEGAVTKPRLVDNGLRNRKNFFQEEFPFSIDDPDALEAVEEAIAELRPAVVAFDTMNNYIGSADIHKSSEAQQSMMWFRNIGRRYNCAVIVLRHLTKGGKEKALYRGQGSIAFSGAARIVMTVGIHPENTEDRVVAVTKMNLAKLPRSVTFRILGLPDKGKKRDRSRFEWGDVVDYTADDILSVTHTSGKNKEKDEAGEFLKDVLGDGAVEAKKVETMAERRSISKRTLQRAAETLGVIKSRKGFGAKSTTWWELPDEQQSDG
ncbi:MAG: hypothetical protein CGW95_01015 [Phenylobacterium zucineum]|nr:MAG: hypothetical protein CGW95_01015 [Phenylobacterium zucineum]